MILITEDPQLGWILAQANPEYREMNIWHRFGSWENLDAFIDFLIEWRKNYKENKTDIPDVWEHGWDNKH